MTSRHTKEMSETNRNAAKWQEWKKSQNGETTDEKISTETQTSTRGVQKWVNDGETGEPGEKSRAKMTWETRLDNTKAANCNVRANSRTESQEYIISFIFHVLIFNFILGAITDWDKTSIRTSPRTCFCPIRSNKRNSALKN